MKGRVTNPATDRRCKLTWPAVFIIRRMRSRMIQDTLAGAFGVTQSNISRVQTGRTWR